MNLVRCSNGGPSFLGGSYNQFLYWSFRIPTGWIIFLSKKRKINKLFYGCLIKITHKPANDKII